MAIPSASYIKKDHSRFRNRSTVPASASSNHSRLYNIGGIWYSIDDAGVITQVSNGILVGSKNSSPLLAHTLDFSVPPEDLGSNEALLRVIPRADARRVFGTHWNDAGFVSIGTGATVVSGAPTDAPQTETLYGLFSSTGVANEQLGIKSAETSEPQHISEMVAVLKTGGANAFSGVYSVGLSNNATAGGTPLSGTGYVLLSATVGTDTTWQLITRTGGVINQTNTSFPFASNTVYKFHLVYTTASSIAVSMVVDLTTPFTSYVTSSTTIPGTSTALLAHVWQTTVVAVARPRLLVARYMVMTN